MNSNKNAIASGINAVCPLTSDYRLIVRLQVLYVNFSVSNREIAHDCYRIERHLRVALIQGVSGAPRPGDIR